MKIIADDKIPYLKGLLEPYCEIEYHPGAAIDKNILKDADGLITRTRTKCNKELLDNTKIKFIATATIGYDHIDTKWCDANGIIWTNAPGCNSGSVMQYIASALVALARKDSFAFSDRTLGVVGYGNVGKKVVRVAEALGMRVVINDPPLVRDRGQCGFISLDGLIRESDIITVHTPLNYEGEDKTYHLFDEKTFSKFNKGTIFINSSRGEVVDTNSIKNAINKGIISRVVMDVWEKEPNIDRQLLEKVFLATPHIAGYSADGKANGTLMSVKAIDNFFRLGMDTKINLGVPLPENGILEIDCKQYTDQEILCNVIEHTFKIAEDDQKLRETPDKFEYLRETYPIRREFGAYTIRLYNSRKTIADSLKILGFKIEFVN
jgi:erythronate-4-phosphate dehydrogenase